jgi:hypothetical protein
MPHALRAAGLSRLFRADWWPLPTVRAVSGNELNNVELWSWVIYGFDWIARGSSTFAAALDRTP